MQEAYLSENLLAVGGTLIRYCTEEKGAVRVPSEENGARMNVLGSGSVTAANAETIMISEGYTRAENNFLYGAHVRNIILPATLESAGDELFTAETTPESICLRRSLPPAARNAVLDCSIPIGKGKRILPSAHLNLTGLAPLQTLTRNLRSPLLPVYNRKLRYLFLEADADDRKTIFDSRRCMDFGGNLSATEEYTAALQMIREGAAGYRDPASEWASDLRIRTGQITSAVRKSKLSCVIFSDPVFLRIAQFHLFAPALYPVRHGGKDWFVYSRLRLNGNAEHPYQREDICVFGREEIVTDRDLADMVYMKARMMMCL